MIYTQPGYEDIIKYIDGEFPPDDSAEFVKNLDIDNNLRNKFNYIQEIDNYLKDEQLSVLRKTVKQVNKQYHNFNSKKRFRKKILLVPQINKLYKAASILLLVTLSLSVVYKLSTPRYSTGEKLFNEYYQPYEEDITTRAISFHMGDFQLAIEAYKNKEYNKSIDYFNKVMVFSSTVNFYKAMASIECKEYKTAITNLQQVINNSANPYYSQAQWYIALTWLKLNNPKNSVQSLTWLKNNDRYYSRKASEILNKLQ